MSKFDRDVFEVISLSRSATVASSSKVIIDWPLGARTRSLTPMTVFVVVPILKAEPGN